MPRNALIQVRRDTSSNWNSVNPVLESGEFGYETDTRRTKIGNGTDPWLSLPYGSGGVTVSDGVPDNPNQGDQWFESDSGKLFVYYDNFWVEVFGGTTGATGPVGPTGPSGGPIGPTGPIGATGPAFGGQLDGGAPNSNYGGILPVNAGGVV